MNCNDKKKFRTAEASSKASLRTKGAIDKFLNILDTNLFRKYNKQWSQDARERFSISGSLFYEENNKAIPNKEAFQTIDKAKILENNENEIKKWLYQRGIPFDKQVFLSWEQTKGMIVPWKIFIKYFDSFYYGSSDDLTIIDQSLNWSLLFYHED